MKKFFLIAVFVIISPIYLIMYFVVKPKDFPEANYE